MIRGPKVIVPVQDEPLTIDECRTHLQAAAYGDSELDPVDDAYILALLASAREHCEQFLGLSLAPRVLEVELDAMPTAAQDGSSAIELPFGPVVEILSMTGAAGGSSSDDETIDPAAWRLDDYSQPNRLLPAGTAWPAVTAPVRIQYLAGYGEDSEGGVPLPAAAAAAIRLVLGHLYAHREENADKAVSALPLGVEALLRPLRVRMGLA